MTEVVHEWVSLPSVQFSHVWVFVTPWAAARQASPSITNSRSLPKLVSIESVMPSSHLILCRPLLLLLSIIPRMRVFSNESALRIRWPKYVLPQVVTYLKAVSEFSPWEVKTMTAPKQLLPCPSLKQNPRFARESTSGIHPWLAKKPKKLKKENTSKSPKPRSENEQTLQCPLRISFSFLLQESKFSCLASTWRCWFYDKMCLVFSGTRPKLGEGNGNPLQYSCLEIL